MTKPHPDDDLEPLGYQHFLCDVNIEYSLGGNQNQSASSEHSFKLKYLPYMVRRHHSQQHFRKSSIGSSDNSSCDQQNAPDDESIYAIDPKLIDVTKATCAFLGNSDYVPSKGFERRRVVLELVSAKLSQSNTYNVPSSSSYTSLVTLAEQTAHHSDNLSLNSIDTSRTVNNLDATTQNNNIPSSNALPSPSVSPLSSKRFVNYTILIKTMPGLDNRPAVIERRFSDFLLLYQGLKSQEAFAKMVNRYVTFPKKIYMGNFSLANIAERSICFSGLLNLCMTNTRLLWSSPFISFLLDKELREAHRLSLCGDPDDVQALIETAYYIQQKLYLSSKQNTGSSSCSSSSLDTNGNFSVEGCSPTSPNGRPHLLDSSTIETISTDISYSQTERPTSADLSISSNMSGCDMNEELDNSLLIDGKSTTALNQRTLVTFCMLFITYYRGENYDELKIAVQEFSQLISTQEYVDSMISTRHYITLRACLLFLMNMNRGNVIDDNQRIWLKRRLEDIDGAQADLNISMNVSSQSTADSNSCSNSPRNRKRNGTSDIVNGNLGVYRVTKGDLTSLLRDRNFCSFQDWKSTR